MSRLFNGGARGQMSRCNHAMSLPEKKVWLCFLLLNIPLH